MVLKSKSPDVVLPEKPLGLYLLEHIDKYGDAVALVEPTKDLQITFRQVKQQSMDFARKLLSLGLEKGDVVGLIAPFKPQFIPLVIGIALANGVLSFYNIQHKANEILNQLSFDGSSICIVDDTTANIKVDELRKSKTIEKGIFTFADISDIELQKDDPEVNLTLVDVDVRNDPLFVCFTSGTTGQPKQVVITNYSMVAVSECCVKGFELSVNDVIATVASRLHAFTVSSAVIYLVQGIKHVIMSTITPEGFDRYVRGYSINGIVMANAYALKKIVDEVSATGKSLKSVLATGVKFPPQLIERARKKLGIVVSSSLGCTEALFITVGMTNSTPLDSAGQLLPNVSMKVHDIFTDVELGPNSYGELCVKSPWTLKGYFKSPNEISEAKDADGWFHTGDFGYYDDQGFIYILDRMKDVIKSENAVSIFPSDLETVLMSHPGVADAAVIRVEHPVYVEAPKAFIVKKDPKLTKDEILSYFNERVAEYKMLHGGLEFIDVIPRSGIGKPLKRLLT